MTVERIHTIGALRARVAAERHAGRRIGFVPTMGALHAGHVSLMDQARDAADVVVTSVFVNPTQFAPGEDLEAYPRDLDADVARMEELGDRAPDLVFAPSVEEMYAGQRVTRVLVDKALTGRLCGASRPTHFDGVGLVVTKLANIVRPDAMFFGRKDFQQLAIVRALAVDLDYGCEIVGCPTVREPDGVAMSSRNRYLQGDERLAARALSRGLRGAVERARAARADGRAPDPASLARAVADTLEADPRVQTDYVDVLDPDTLQPPDAPHRDDRDAATGDAPPDRQPVGGEGGRPASHIPEEDATTSRWDEGNGRQLLVACAAHVGRARLIDNVVIGDLADEDRLLAATDDARS